MIYFIILIAVNLPIYLLLVYLLFESTDQFVDGIHVLFDLSLWDEEIGLSCEKPYRHAGKRMLLFLAISAAVVMAEHYLWGEYFQERLAVLL